MFGAVLLRELSLAPQAIPLKLSGSRHPNARKHLRVQLIATQFVCFPSINAILTYCSQFNNMVQY